MKSLRLPLLTALLTLALVGLVGLQLYWTNKAYQITRQRFKQATHEALQAVAQRLEQREIIYATQRSANKLQDSLRVWEMQRQEYENAHLTQLQALEAERHAKLWAMKPPVVPSTPNAPTQVSISIDNKERKQGKKIKTTRRDGEQVVVFSGEYVNITQRFDTITHNIVGKEMNVLHFDSKDSYFNFTTDYLTKESPALPAPPKPSELKVLPANAKKPTKEFIKIKDKEDVLKFLVQEISQEKPNLDKRLSKRLLDSMIRYELAQRGIYLPYRFGIETLPRKEILPTHNPVYTNQQVCKDVAQLTDLNSYEKPRYLYFPNPKDKVQILQSEFHTQLYPTEIIGNKNTLFIHFPQEITWLWNEMAFTGGASLLFIALIIGCFAYALYTIWKQKKISEITNDFINNMTHEFKTPVATVALACEALQDPDMRKIHTYTDRYLQIIKEENERLGRQVERVLQIAMLDKTDFKLKLQHCDLYELVQEAIHKISLQVESRQGTITTSDLQALETCLQADEVHLTNVILNLLDNAVKYSPDAPQISIATRSTPEGLHLTISDKGQGMTKEAQCKIFDKFYRVHTGNVHNVKGFGLGLSYVRTVVQAHNGRVSVQSEVGNGSTFSIFLPFTQPNAS